MTGSRVVTIAAARNEQVKDGFQSNDAGPARSSNRNRVAGQCRLDRHYTTAQRLPKLGRPRQVQFRVPVQKPVLAE